MLRAIPQRNTFHLVLFDPRQEAFILGFPCRWYPSGTGPMDSTPAFIDQSPALHPAGVEREDPLLPHYIRAEANLLRLPLFALHTKGLRTLDGIECSGRRTDRDGQTHEYTFRATRNTGTLYPGPLARSAHLAFLSLLTERGLPLQNPITWSWRDLCRRMRVEYGGWIVRCLKQAISSTHGLVIESQYALYQKDQDSLLHSHEEKLHLYDRLTFVGSPLEDGGKATSNNLWLSSWYLRNLNSLYSAPLDYGLWRHLDARSSFASRLYEFLLVNFYSGTPVLRINYQTLIQFLPIIDPDRKRFRSEAQRQLQAAFDLLTNAGIIAQAVWTESRDGQTQLQLYRGTRLFPPTTPDQGVSPLPDEAFEDAFAARTLRNLKPPEWQLVIDFYRLWTGNDQARPTRRELAQASELITANGEAKAKKLLPLAVKQMKVKWPDAKSFGAVFKYLPDAVAEFQRLGRKEEARRQEELQERQEREATAQRTQERAAMKALWNALPPEEQETIRHAVCRGREAMNLQKHPGILENFCLDELARRQQPNQAPCSPTGPSATLSVTVGS